MIALRRAPCQQLNKSLALVMRHKSELYPNTPDGIKERTLRSKKGPQDTIISTPLPPFPEGKNPKTGEVGGPAGPEPTRFGDWERKGRVSDF